MCDKRTVKTNENFRIQIKAAGYDKTNFKVKCKVCDDKSQVVVVDAKKSSVKNKFGFFKGLDGFRDETPINKDIYDIDKMTADYVGGIFEVVVPKWDDFKTKTIIDFAPVDTDVAPATENEE